MAHNNYSHEFIKIVEYKLVESYFQLYKNTKSDFQNGYRTEIDISPVLDNDDTNHFQFFVGQLIWALELGCIDNNLEISLLSCYLYQPCSGHIDQAFHVLSHLKSRNRINIVVDSHKSDFYGNFTNYN